MGIRGFYWEVIKRAFSGRFWFAEKISGACALFLGLGVAYFGKWESALNWLPFAVFAGVFIATVAVGMLVAPHQIYQEEVAKNAELKAAPSAMVRLFRERDYFTLRESACLLAGEPIRSGELVGASAAYLYTLKRMVTKGELVPSNMSASEVAMLKMRRQALASGVDIKVGELRDDLEIGKTDLAAAAINLGRKYQPNDD